MKKFIIQDREAGNFISSFNSKDEAEKELARYEQDDKKGGIYTPNFYEIVEDEEQKEYLVEFNNGLESDENNLAMGFDSLEDAKKYAKDNVEVYYSILKGEFELIDNIWTGCGVCVLTNCDDSSISWFYSESENFCSVDNL